MTLFDDDASNLPTGAAGVYALLLLLGAVAGCADFWREQKRLEAEKCHAVLSYARTSLDTVNVLVTDRYNYCVAYGRREAP